MNEVNIYACGGAGCNQALPFIRFIGKEETGFAKINPYFIDTSRSNLDPSVPADNIWLYDGVDGAGKDRAEHVAIISENKLAVLKTFKPGSLNIVLHSTAGGSGSVIGPILAKQLIANGHDTIIIAIGNVTSKIETRNSLRTLETYEKFANDLGVPFPMVYRENGFNMSRGQVDTDIQATITMLATMWSGQHRGLDSADLRNLLNYTRVTSFKPRLVGMELFSVDVTVEKNTAVISMATLEDPEVSSHVDILCEYHTTGIMNPNARNNCSIPLPIHAALFSNAFHSTIERLNKRLAAFEAERGAHVEKPIAISGNTDSDIVL